VTGVSADSNHAKLIPLNEMSFSEHIDRTSALDASSEVVEAQIQADDREELTLAVTVCDRTCRLADWCLNL
jgi:hypothetical protein